MPPTAPSTGGPGRSTADPAAPGDAGPAIIEPLCAIFRRRLKQEGLKYTPERARILDAIARRGEDKGVFEAEELISDLRSAGERVSKATVYRTIKLLTDAGVLQQVLFHAEQAHYLLAYGTRATGLLVRVDTGQISTIELPELAAIRDRICREKGLAAEGHRFVVYARSR
ncbi:MAG TPA: transcriptional repressor [Phycisphaerales bacterium]|nr:transcriptional repressor [Phycisphaerales bacterium]